MADAEHTEVLTTEGHETERGELMFDGPWACLAGAVLLAIVGVWWYLDDAFPDSRFQPWLGVAVATGGSILMVYEFFKKRGSASRAERDRTGTRRS